MVLSSLTVSCGLNVFSPRFARPLEVHWETVRIYEHFVSGKGRNTMEINMFLCCIERLFYKASCVAR